MHLRLFAMALALSFGASVHAAEVATETDSSEGKRYGSSNCRILNNQPQAGCTEEDLCSYSSVIYAHVCRQVEARRKHTLALEEEGAAVGKALKTSDELFSVEDECDANAKTLGKGAVLASVVPFKIKQIENAPPSVAGYNIVGMGAREVEVSKCRFWFKKR